jgi:hypothetical protein
MKAVKSLLHYLPLFMADKLTLKLAILIIILLGNPKVAEDLQKLCKYSSMEN